MALPNSRRAIALLLAIIVSLAGLLAGPVSANGKGRPTRVVARPT